MSPMAPKRACLEPRCPGLAVRNGRCPAHAEQRQAEIAAGRRADGVRAFYRSTAWRTLRARFLRDRRAPLSPALRAYLERGDYHSGAPDVDLYLLAGRVIRGNAAPLAAVWALHGAEILASWRGPGRPWAERRLGAMAAAGDLHGNGNDTGHGPSALPDERA